MKKQLNPKWRAKTVNSRGRSQYKHDLQKQRATHANIHMWNQGMYDFSAYCMFILAYPLRALANYAMNFLIIIHSLSSITYSHQEYSLDSFKFCLQILKKPVKSYLP